MRGHDFIISGDHLIGEIEVEFGSGFVIDSEPLESLLLRRLDEDGVNLMAKLGLFQEVLELVVR